MVPITLRAALGLSALGLSACLPSLEHEEAHEPDMPETSTPLVQDFEDGPVTEGYFEAAGISASFLDGQPGYRATFVTLQAASSRVTVWLTLHDAQASTPAVQVQAGWTNGQAGPFVNLTQVWSEGAYRVLSADLETAATRLQFQLPTETLADIAALRWAANIPLAEGRRTLVVEPPAPAATSAVAARSSYGAIAGRCGQPQDEVRQVVLHQAPGPLSLDAPEGFLRALQAFDLMGLKWCDQRSSYVLGPAGTFMARGSYWPAMAATQAQNAGVSAVLALGCEAPSQGVQEELTRLLDELTQAHGLSSAAQFSVATGGPCPQGSSTWLNDALQAWLLTAPFVVEPPPPPPPPPPPTTTGTVSGRVFDSDTGDATSGAAVSGAEVLCSCGLRSVTDAQGRYLFKEVPQGLQTLSVSKTEWLPASFEVTVVAGQAVSADLGIQPEPEPPPTGVSVIDHSFLITHFGGTVTNPLQYAETQAGFQQYLDAVGVTYFAAWEYVEPNNPSVAQGCGYSILLPDRSMWPRAAALGLLADRLRVLVNEPVTLRNWWRPPCYNTGVGGAAGGDHPDGDALDLDFRSARSRADAQRFLCETYWQTDIVAPGDIAPGSNLNPRLNMSIGLGGDTIHLGLLSRNGRRYWRYSSYTSQSNSGTCW